MGYQILLLLGGWNKNSTKAVQLTTGIGVGQALIFPDTSQEEDQQSFNSTLCFYINITWTRKRIEKQLYISFILLYGALLFFLPSSYCQNNLFNFKLFKTLIILFWGGFFFLRFSYTSKSLLQICFKKTRKGHFPAVMWDVRQPCCLMGKEPGFTLAVGFSSAADWNL